MDQPIEIKSCCCANKQAVPPPEPVSKVKKTARTLPSVLLSILIAFFPKCPLCWAAYMSMFGSLGLARLPYMNWLLPVLMVFLGIHLFILFRRVHSNGYLPFIISLAGALVIISGRMFFPSEKWVMMTGMACIIAGSLLNSFSPRRSAPVHTYKII